MENKSGISKRYIYLTILIVSATVLFLAVKDLYFFDEDIFVVNRNNEFMSQNWQRSLICKLTFWADNYFYGTSPLGYHVTNLLFHILDTILAVSVFEELLKIGKNNFTQFQQTSARLMFFILFLLTPVHSEPVCYILARGGSVVTFFNLLSILFFLKAEFQNKILLVFSLLSFLAALFCYEISWMLPLIIFSISIYLWYNKFAKIFPQKKLVLFTLPYFIVFAGWFIIKVVFVDKLEVSDYNTKNLFSINFATFFKNNGVLFLRNFIPPIKNTSVFLIVSSFFILGVIAGLIKLLKINKQIFSLSVLLILLTILSFSAVSVIGIDSHDSESERYIYFSSAFALMLLSVLLIMLIKNKIVLSITFFILVAVYSFSLFKTINYYREAAVFSTKYLTALNNQKADKTNFFMINLPSQYHGALLFRARSRLNDNHTGSITTLNEFMLYLHQVKAVKYITLSTYEITKIPEAVRVYEKPFDSVRNYLVQEKIKFSDSTITTQKNETYPFLEATSAIVILKDSALVIFK
jgi:hypothetical protein